MTASFRDKLQPSEQKRLLALDGGGIRGVITLEVLEKIESIVRQKLGRVDAVLADYFDYIAGTSTGAIIATCLALGKTVDEVRTFYVDSGPAMFSKAGVLRRFHYKFDQEQLAGKLKSVLGEQTTVGSDNLRTLLMMVMRNATTDSPWPVSNNPAAKYNDKSRPNCNLNLPLWQLVRASTAAPTYFPPEIVTVGEHSFLFEDGGVTMHNNPAFQLFLMATADPYNLRWPVGVDKLLLVSVGTGTSPNANANLHPGDMNILYNAGSIPSALMFAALNEQDLLCRMFGKTEAGCALDREVGDLHGQGISSVPKLFTYMRYNAELSDKGLADLGIRDIEPASVQGLDSVDQVTSMQTVGKAIAESEVAAAHFAAF
jgi:uncharacterized protein